MGGEPPPSDNIYIPNLPAGITEEQVRLVFEPMGDITEIQVLPPNGSPEQAALVRFKSVEVAAKVIELVDSLGGNVGGGLTEPISVRFADPPPRWGRERPGSGDRSRGSQWQDGGSNYGKATGGWGKDDGKSVSRGGPYDGQKGGKGGIAAGTGDLLNERLNIANLPGDTRKEEVETIFNQYGQVREVEIIEQSKERSAAVIRFHNAEEAAEVKEALDGNLPQGLERNKEPLSITFYAPPQKQQWTDEKPWTEEQQGASWSGSTGSCSGAGSVTGSKTSSETISGTGGGTAGATAGGNGGSGKTWKGGNFSMTTVVKGFEVSGALPGGSGWNDDDGTQVPLFIRGLAKDCEDIDIYKLFGSFGAIAPRGVRAIKNPDGACKGYGFVNFLDPDSAEVAIAALNDTLLPDGVTKLQVAHKNEGKSRSDGKGGGKGGQKGWHQQPWQQQEQQHESMDDSQGSLDGTVDPQDHFLNTGSDLKASPQLHTTMAPAAEGSPAALAAAAAMQAAAHMQAMYW